MRKEAQEEHRRILEAARAKDMTAAVAALAFHLEKASKNLQSHMETRNARKEPRHDGRKNFGSGVSRPE
jgi:DNA-binding GntR family transcriptional regulator